MSLRGYFCVIYSSFCCGCCWRFRGGGKGSDEEHITYSGGSKIKDLAQCGWEEKREKRKKMKYEKNENNELSK